MMYVHFWAKSRPMRAWTPSADIDPTASLYTLGILVGERLAFLRFTRWITNSAAGSADAFPHAAFGSSLLQPRGLSAHSADEASSAIGSTHSQCHPDRRPFDALCR
jgi:hypothetical protein